MITATLIHTFPVHNVLGEGVIWDAGRGCAWWTDIESRQLFRAAPDDAEPEAFATPERLCAFALIAGSDTLLCAFESGFGLWSPGRTTIEWWHRLDTHPGVRLNDGKTDRQGRFWCGGLQEADTDEQPGGVLWSVGPHRAVHAHRDGIRISNSIAIAPDGNNLYFADTPTRTIERYPLDAATGALGAPSTFTTTPSGASPDGSAVDAAGRLWNAQWGASRVVCYAPDGSSTFVLDTPASQPTCVAFGGPNLDLLFVTSARQDLAPEALAAEPDAGNAFIYQLNVRGLEDAPFRPA